MIPISSMPLPQMSPAGAGVPAAPPSAPAPTPSPAPTGDRATISPEARETAPPPREDPIATIREQFKMLQEAQEPKPISRPERNPWTGEYEWPKPKPPAPPQQQLPSQPQQQQIPALDTIQAMELMQAQIKLQQGKK